MLLLLKHLAVMAVVFGIAWWLESRLMKKLGIQRRTVFWVLAVGLAVVLALLSVPFLNLVLLGSLAASGSDELSDIVGADPYARWAILILFLTAALLWWRFHRRLKEHRFVLVLGLLLGVAAFYGGLSVLSQDHRFTADGASLDCYVVQDHGVEYRPIRFEGVDPRTGRPCRRFTVAIADQVALLDRRLRAGQGIRPLDGLPERRFSPVSGEPLLWYEIAPDGDILFYDVPGHSPSTGAALTPIDQTIVANWRQRQDQQSARRRAEEQAAAEARRREVERDLEAQEQISERARDEFASSLWIADDERGRFVQFAADPQGFCSRAMLVQAFEAVSSRLSARCVWRTQPLAPAFSSSGEFERAHRGEDDLLSRIAGLDQHSLILVDAECSCRDAESRLGTSCEAQLAMTEFSDGRFAYLAKPVSGIFASTRSEPAQTTAVALAIEALGETLTCSED